MKSDTTEGIVGLIFLIILGCFFSPILYIVLGMLSIALAVWLTKKWGWGD